MVEPKSKIESIREWVVDHKLRTVGCLWLSGIAGSIAYNWSQPEEIWEPFMRSKVSTFSYGIESELWWCAILQK
ncbi:hypothetical protein Goklo_021417, partial [Gossypium klotzschianum]|nr:hypothetical protein [Gossypium klotzschianum]